MTATTTLIVGELKVKQGEELFLYLNEHSRDTLVAVNSFLVCLHDKFTDPYDKIRLGRVIDSVSDMLYSPESEGEGE